MLLYCVFRGQCHYVPFDVGVSSILAAMAYILSVHEWNRLNSVFETEFSLPFLPIFRNDAMALVGSQGTILSTMASISSENVAARGDGV